MFCPDWKNNLICRSHMGEMNLRVAAGKPELMEKDFPFTDAGNPVVLEIVPRGDGSLEAGTPVDMETL